MSLSYNSKSVIGGKFDQGVEDQLELRKSVINKVNTRTSDDVKYLTSTTGWVRVISSVDTLNTDRTYTSETAKKYILLGGTLDSYSGFNPGQPGSSYTKSSEYGFVPTAGITSFQVQSKGTFGTLKTASFNFTVNSPEEFSKLEQLYLRPGFSILLEWGHSFHLSNTEKRLIPTADLFPLEDFLNTSSDLAIESKIEKLKKLNSHNYDGIFGIIKNFIWNYNGYTYECQVDVISKGEVVESVKTSMAPLTKLSPNTVVNNSKYDTSEYGSELLGFLKLISSTSVSLDRLLIQTTIRNRLENENEPLSNKSLSKKLFQRLEEVKSTNQNFLVTNKTFNSSPESSNEKYITLRVLLILVNEVNLLYNNNTPIVAFNVGENNSKNTYTTFFKHFGLDPGICILPHSLKFLVTKFSNQSSFTAENDILDIFVSVNFLIKILQEYNFKSDKETTVADFILTVMSEIQINLGGINYFDILDDKKGVFTFLHIVDRKVIPSRNNITTKLDLIGLGSEVTNLNITSKISNNLASMISIAAQDTYSPSSAEDLFNLQSWNTGLKDRHLNNLKVGRISSNVGLKFDTQNDLLEFISSLPAGQENFVISTVNGNIVVEENISIKLFAFQEIVFNVLFETGLGKNQQPQDPSGFRAVHDQVMKELVREETNTAKTNPPGLIPFELSFTTKGISGIKVGQAFKINDFFLPERYKGRTGFIVTGVDHTVSENRWNTEIKSQLIFI